MTSGTKKSRVSKKKSVKSKDKSSNATARYTAAQTISITQSTRSSNQPRNIILFSDGTANSAASLNKTNVWRLFEALNLGSINHGSASILANSSDDYHQLAFYNDGVGTSGPKIFMYLAQALGLGVSRNVRNLYRQLCQHYQPGDRIYIFGFSRGAFTARVLCDMIASCGILDREKEAPNLPNVSMERKEGLEAGVREARRAYRNMYWERSGPIPKTLNRIYRRIREKLFGRKNFYTIESLKEVGRDIPPDRDFLKTFSHSYDKMQGDSEYEKEIVTFLGVWDTVDSHGLPVDELSDLWDMVYPYKFKNYKISPHVRRVRHALAIDDERQSFHPLLIDETGESKERISQVWFSGMHADIGGGYPDDNLSKIPLSWMIGEVSDPSGKNGLIFKYGALEEARANAQPTSTIHDSRRGFASYFRYQPRNLEQLSINPQNEDDSLLGKPVIHQSALDRILDSKAGYAPAGLPADLEICTIDGAIISPRSLPKYSLLDSDKDNRTDFHKRVKNHIFWRRFSYFAMLIPTLLLFIVPLFEPSIPGWIVPTDQGWWRMPHSVMNNLLVSGGSYIPFHGFLSYWTSVWVQSAWWTLLLASLATISFFWSYWIQSNIQRLAEAGWWKFKGNASKAYNKKPKIFERIALYIINFGNAGTKSHTIFSIMKTILLFLAIVAAIGLLLVLILRFITFPNGASLELCNLENQKFQDVSQRNKYWIVKSPISNPCIKTKINIKKDQEYRFFVKSGAHLDESGKEILRMHDPLCMRDLPVPPWHDNRLAWTSMGASYKGLSCAPEFFRLSNLTGNVNKRLFLYPWMMLVAQIGENSKHMTIPVNRSETLFKTPIDGVLSFYVNQEIDVSGFSKSGAPDGVTVARHYEKLEGDVEIIVHRLD